MNKAARSYKVLKSAGIRIDNIFQYSRDHWSQKQAEYYIEGMFKHFEAIANGHTLLKPIPAEFEVQGFFSLYEKHVIYSKDLTSGQVGIVTVLHERMHQIEHFREDFG